LFRWKLTRRSRRPLTTPEYLYWMPNKAVSLLADYEDGTLDLLNNLAGQVI